SILDGSLQTVPQPEGEFTPAPKIFKEDCRIDWNQSAEKIFNLVRGLSPYPAAWSVMEMESGKALDVKIFEVKPAEGRVPLQVGEVKIEGKKLFVGCGEGAVEILSLQPAGKKRMEASAFLLGYSPLSFMNL
ncbi:MAG: methionyl-tRNA formyltransferase, partial [Muribaculaceae bacterium]|nr:methionyl-tRNA formyltransferase [Muribaculaceae bacterium]